MAITWYYGCVHLDSNTKPEWRDAFRYTKVVKGAMCNISEDLLTEMQYDIHNMFSVVYKDLTQWTVMFVLP